jgi:hypothetical protein
MRKIAAADGMTSGLKSGLREVERDNEEAIIGTQLWLGTSDCHARRLAESEGR